MVLFKRKPVQFLPPPAVEDDDTEVWHIPQTGEIFLTYEDYLNRMDFYGQRRFNDQITGHSGLTFFEAFKKELMGGQEVEASFPEALKGPILRKVQFQIISRLDNLVDLIFDDFKQDYYPGEKVTVTVKGGEKVQGLVRDKTAFGPRVLPDGTRTLPTTRYHVTFKDSDGEAMVTDEHVCRDRGVFTKAMLRSFIKKTVAREAWNGAPWLVKREYAEQYQIDTRIPPHLRHDTKIMERKQLQAQKRASLPQELNGHTSALQPGPVRLPELKPAPKGHKAKIGQNGIGPKGHKWPHDEHDGSRLSSDFNLPYHDQKIVHREPTPPPPPPPPKYPIEDLQLDPQPGSVRPELHFMCRDPPVSTEDQALDPLFAKIDMASVGSFLETWDTLNVYCEIFKLDSFTFDDFVEAMSVASEHLPVQLVDEIHCSVLKVLVDSEADGGKVRITLPEVEEDNSDEEGEEEEEEEEEEPEPEPKPVARATRSSLAKLEAEKLAAEAAAAEEEELKAELATRPRAEELLQDYDWIEHLRKRDFTNGGWERILVGLFHQLSKNPRYEKACEEILLKLVPPEIEPTQESVRQQYAELDVNIRIKALQIICMLTMETKAVRGYMEDCSETMTKYRKDRIEWQRQKRQATEELRPLLEQRKMMLPDNMPPSPPPQDEDVKMTDADESLIDKDEDARGSDDEGLSRRKRRRQSDKQRKREEEQERKAKEKAQKEAPKLPPGQTKQFNKLLKEIRKKEDVIKQCEEEIATIENDLREADCPRTRVLGKDRFWNRYYWFERNGMPYAGLPDSSTASAGYANGCIWVQGPDDLEREGYIDLPQDLQDEYKAKFNMTVPERKAMEEGKTSVFTARQWGYIAEPEHVEALIMWLDPRGFNETKLRKELVTFKDKIMAHMENRKKYLTESEGADRKEETKRTSSRIRDKTPEAPNYRCLQWENTMALEELGHLHSDPPPPPRPRKQTKKREAAAEADLGPVPKSRRR
ncbi:ATP-utilizing chromatin assembly and remodelling N-terminal-domain-containing protein [Stachybotrys elegans]|uniref:ATP-utilizing chromatin assembly and remodelling N-terminal-domain-containing protein n=1 Tax=Stachybotrys elegans TaxID=80388 RepID=A0A8K0SHE9_9HYPO|nr:ATP-utilizing chromatin assembly and remodelling N-terminal-domain-containing protein [Stachybotrys elegans]